MRISNLNPLDMNFDSQKPATGFADPRDNLQARAPSSDNVSPPFSTAPKKYALMGTVAGTYDKVTLTLKSAIKSEDVSDFSTNVSPPFSTALKKYALTGTVAGTDDKATLTLKSAIKSEEVSDFSTGTRWLDNTVPSYLAQNQKPYLSVFKSEPVTSQSNINSSKLTPIKLESSCSPKNTNPHLAALGGEPLATNSKRNSSNVQPIKLQSDNRETCAPAASAKPEFPVEYDVNNNSVSNTYNDIYCHCISPPKPGSMHHDLQENKFDSQAVIKISIEPHFGFQTAVKICKPTNVGENSSCRTLVIKTESELPFNVRTKTEKGFSQFQSKCLEIDYSPSSYSLPNTHSSAVGDTMPSMLVSKSGASDKALIKSVSICKERYVRPCFVMNKPVFSITNQYDIGNMVEMSDNLECQRTEFMANRCAIKTRPCYVKLVRMSDFELTNQGAFQDMMPRLDYPELDRATSPNQKTSIRPCYIELVRLPERYGNNGADDRTQKIRHVPSNELKNNSEDVRSLGRPFQHGTLKDMKTSSVENIRPHLDQWKIPRDCIGGECGKSSCHAHSLKRHELIHTISNPCKCDQRRHSNRYDFLNAQKHNNERFTERSKFEIRNKSHSGFDCANRLIHSKNAKNSTLVDKIKHNKTSTSHPILKQRDSIHRKLYVCDKCTLAFTAAYLLKRHKIIHTEIKPYVCDQCGKRCRRKDNLKDHVLRHNTIRPKARHSTCDQCGLGFTSAFELKRHKIIHTDIKPYACDQCGKRCRRKNNLKDHVLNQHGTRTRPIPS